MTLNSRTGPAVSFSRILSFTTTGIFVACTQAEVITVGHDGKADFGSIQAAVDYASDGDEILVAPGVYTEDDPDHVVDLLGKSITLRSSDGPDLTIIDGEGVRRGIDCVNGEDNDTIIKGFTITGGRGTYGGGMTSYESSPTVENCRFTGNTADYGGGMYNIYSSPIVIDCSFGGNTASASGGGMFNLHESSPALTNCTFSENTAETWWGGGLLNGYDSSPTLDACTFTNNHAATGGGMYNHNLEGDDSTPTVAGTVLCGNAPDQVHGPWTDNSGNCLAFSCVDDNGDGIPEECGITGGSILDVPSEAYPTIASAIAAAAYGDVVSIAAGTYLPAETLNVQGKPIILRGSVDEGGAPATIIDGQYLIRVLQCTSGEGANTIFENLVITGGNTGDNGGGMYNDASSPTLNNCTFTGNRSTNNGGGMYNLESRPALSHCTFEDNVADDSGGAMFNEGSSPALAACSFTANQAGEIGGGMYNQGGSPMLENCTFAGNSANRSGGGMFNIENSSPTLEQCAFIDNQADFSGGGMYNEGSSPQVLDNTFNGNRANIGGGMYNRESNPMVLDSAFSGNYTGSSAFNHRSGSESLVTARQGGGMYNVLSSPTVTNCSFFDNASYFGGGMSNATSSPSVTGCTFTGNTADESGGGLYNYESSAMLADSTVCGNTPDQIEGDWSDSGGNLIAMSCDCPIDFNGDGVVDGYELTHVLGAWGTDDSVADVNDDGIVDGADLTDILASWGQCS